MATKFGYVERNIENDVNWGEVGKGFADMLVAEREERQAKKDLLDDVMIKTQDALKEAPLGYNTDFNDRIIGLADNASSYLLAANKDLKSGQITPAEYMRKVQRMNSSADQIFNLSNNYNKLYEEHLNRLDDGVSGKVEQAIFEKIDNMTNFNENDFFIDSTGAIVAAPLVKGKDGITTIDPSRAMSAQAMFNLAQNFVNKVDVEAEAKKSADRLATFIKSTSTAPDYRNKGRTEIITDIRQRGDYLELKKSLIDGILSSDLSTSSVLADYIGGYDVVTKRDELSKDPAEREKQIYIDISNGKEGRAELTESQKEIAEERIGLVLEGMIDSKTMVSETAKKEYSASQISTYKKNQGIAEKNKNILNMIKNLYSGSDSQIDQAVEYFRDYFIGEKTPNVKVGRTNKGIYVDYKDANGQTNRRNIVFEGKTLIDFIETASPLLVGERDLKEAIKKANYKGEESFKEYEKEFFAEVTAAPTLKKEIDDFVSNRVDVEEDGDLEEPFSKDANDAEDGIVAHLNRKFKDVGIKFLYDGDASDGELRIEGSDLPALKIEANYTYTDGWIKYAKEIRKYIRKHMELNESQFRNILRGEGSVPEEEKITEDKSGELDG